MDQEKTRKSGRSVKKINENDRSESNSPSFMDYDEEEEDIGPRKGGRMKALSKLQAKEDANSLFMSNFDPSVSRKAKLKDKTYKDHNIPGNISGNIKNTKKESLYDGKGILILVGFISVCLTVQYSILVSIISVSLPEWSRCLRLSDSRVSRLPPPLSQVSQLELFSSCLAQSYFQVPRQQVRS